MKSMTSTPSAENPPTHRILRAFPIDGKMAEPGDFVSDAGWSYQGLQNVTVRGWVERLTNTEIANWLDDQKPAKPVAAKPAKKAAAKKATAKKRAPRKAVVKKTTL